MTHGDGHWMERYSRQILLPEIGGIGQKKLNQGKVILSALDAIGLPLLLYGTAAGIGHWVILDGEPEKLSKAMEAVRKREPDARIQCCTREQALQPGAEQDQLLAGASLLVVNDPDERHTTLLKRCHSLGPGLLVAWYRGNQGWISHNPCPDCLLLEPNRQPLAHRQQDSLGEMVPGLLATNLAQRAVQHLLNPEKFSSTPEMMVFQADTSTFMQQKPHRHPNCATCNPDGAP